MDSGNSRPALSATSWGKFSLGGVTLGAGVVNLALSKEVLSGWMEVSEVDHLYGAQAAVFAMLAAFTLFITMFLREDREFDEDLHQALYFVGLLLAFGSGFYWLKSELPDPAPYLYALGTVVAIYVIGIGWGVAVGFFLSSLSGRILRHFRKEDPG